MRDNLKRQPMKASAITPQSLIPVYGATKIYALQLSRSLQNQFPYRFSGVRFHAFHPQFIKTPMTEGKLKIESRYIFPEASDWIVHALKTVGKSSGMSVGYFWHEFLVWLQVNAIPLLQFIFANDKGTIIDHLHNINSDYIFKLASIAPYPLVFSCKGGVLSFKTFQVNIQRSPNSAINVMYYRVIRFDLCIKFRRDEVREK